MPEKALRTVITDADAARIEALAQAGHRGDLSVDPPIEPTDDSSEIARRIVHALDKDFSDPASDDLTRNAAYSDLRGLAVTGAAAVARRILRAPKPFKITRNGSVTTVARTFSVPSHLITNGRTAEADARREIVPTNRRQYIQLDFATWELIEWLRDHLTARRDGLGVTVTSLDEILKLKDVFPGLSPHDAMLKAGLDPATMQVNLDTALAALDDEPDVGIIDA